MNPTHFASGLDEPTPVITRATATQWHAVENGRILGRGDASPRPDGRVFLSIDTWHSSVFDRLADTMVADLAKPLHTVVDESETELISRWERVGFAIGRRECEYVVPTDPRITGLDSIPSPPDVTVMAVGEASEGPLRTLDRAVRDEVEATVGWPAMPAEVVPSPHGVTVLDPSKYAVAVHSDRYVGLARIAPVTRRPRIGLIAVLADHRRRGIARALLARLLGSLHDSGVTTASAEVDETNKAAMALFDGVGARRTNSNLELVCR